MKSFCLTDNQAYFEVMVFHVYGLTVERNSSGEMLLKTSGHPCGTS